MLADILTGAAVLLWLVVAAKAPGTVRHGSPAARWLLATFAFIAAGFTAFIPVVVQGLARATGVVDIHQLAGRVLILVSLACAQHVLGESPRLRVTNPRTPVLLLACCVLGMSVAFANRDQSAPFESHLDRSLPMTAFMGAFLLGLCFMLVLLAAGCWDCARRTDGALRKGLRLLGVSCAGGLLYAIYKIAAMLCFAAGLTIDSEVNAAAGRLIVAMAAIPLAAGAAITSAHERLTVAKAWVNAHRDHRTLYPLWAELATTYPAIALEPPRGALHDALRLRDLRLRLYRRVIELTDASMMMQSDEHAKDGLHVRLMTAAAVNAQSGAAEALPFGSELPSDDEWTVALERLLELARQSGRGRRPSLALGETT